MGEQRLSTHPDGLQSSILSTPAPLDRVLDNPHHFLGDLSSGRDHFKVLHPEFCSRASLLLVM